MTSAVAAAGMAGAAAAGGAGATVAARAAARRLGIMNDPNPIVPQHVAAVAYLGGAGVWVGAAAVLVSALAFLDAGNPSRHAAMVLMGPGLGFLVVGTLDDVLTFDPLLKLALQALATAVALAAGLAGPLAEVAPLEALLVAGWVLLVVNAVNVTDVCDGLVGGLAVVALSAIAIANGDIALAAVAIAGATMGFLPFNWPPATIFLGDGGSHLLGYAVAAAGVLHFEAHRSAASAALAVLIAAVFLIEVGLLVVARHRRRLPVWQGSPDHFALRLQAWGMGRVGTVLLAWTGGSGFALVGIVLTRRGASPAALAAGLTAAVVAGVLAVRALLAVDMSARKGA